MNWLKDQINRVIDWVDSLSDSQRRAVLVTGLLVVAVVIGWLIYWVFFRSLLQPSVVNENGNVTSNGQLPNINLTSNQPISTVNTGGTLPVIDTVARGKETLSQVIYNGTAASPALSGDGNTVQFYNADDGKFYRVDANGTIVTMSDQAFKGVEQVTWSTAGNKAVLEFEDQYKLMYDFNAKKQYTLNKDMEDFDFSANDNQLGFKFIPPNEEDRWLGISNPDGSNAKGIEPLGENEDKVIVQWSPDNTKIGTFQEYVEGDRQRVVPIGLKGENFKQFLVSGRGLKEKWSPDGKSLLYSTYSTASNYNYTLHVVTVDGDRTGANNHPLNLTTSVDKCAYNTSGTNIYCAVPTSTPTGAAIAPSKLNDIPHEIYRVNLTTGQSDKVAIPADNVNGANLKGINDIMINDLESVLYYREADTNQLRKIQLK